MRVIGNSVFYHAQFAGVILGLMEQCSMKYTRTQSENDWYMYVVGQIATQHVQAPSSVTSAQSVERRWS